MKIPNPLSGQNELKILLINLSVVKLLLKHHDGVDPAAAVQARFSSLNEGSIIKIAVPVVFCAFLEHNGRMNSMWHFTPSLIRNGPKWMRMKRMGIHFLLHVTFEDLGSMASSFSDRADRGPVTHL